MQTGRSSLLQVRPEAGWGAARLSSSSPAGATNNGSYGMLCVVLVVIVVLAFVAGLLARLCGGRHVAGSMEYDFEGWVEKKCASCIDGSIPASSSHHFHPGSGRTATLLGHPGDGSSVNAGFRGHAPPPPPLPSPPPPTVAGIPVHAAGETVGAHPSPAPPPAGGAGVLSAGAVPLVGTSTGGGAGAGGVGAGGSGSGRKKKKKSGGGGASTVTIAPTPISIHT